jgi:hypothetical protein
MPIDAPPDQKHRETETLTDGGGYAMRSAESALKDYLQVLKSIAPVDMMEQNDYSRP